MSVASLTTASKVLAYPSVSGNINLLSEGTGEPCRWIKNGGGGDIVIIDASGQQVTLFDGGAGSIEYVAAQRILAAGTTATNINVYF